jgi:cytochrome c553
LLLDECVAARANPFSVGLTTGRAASFSDAQVAEKKGPARAAETMSSKSMSGRLALLLQTSAAIGLAATLITGARATARTDLDWAFPTQGSAAAPTPNPARILTVPGSRIRFTRAQVESGFLAIDWWPNDHPPLPAVVHHGRPPDVLACGFCHLPNGEGRPENAAVAGLSVRYIKEQLRDIRSGARKSIHPAWLPSAVMDQIAHHVTSAEIANAAAYFSKRSFIGRTKVVEAAEIPAASPEAFVYRRSPGNRRETLGLRIVETPADFHRFDLRDGTVGYIAYVPPGALARGRELAATGDHARVPACATCHGPELRGSGDTPPLAGRSPTQLFRQLAGFHARTRRGTGDAPMLVEAEPLSTSDMIDIAAYLGSLRP